VTHGCGSRSRKPARAPLRGGSTCFTPEQTIDLYFAIPAPAGGHWIDAIVDTVRGVDELDESNNVSSAFVTLADAA
jgi:hypothetical protein